MGYDDYDSTENEDYYEYGEDEYISPENQLKELENKGMYYDVVSRVVASGSIEPAVQFLILELDNDYTSELLLTSRNLDEKIIKLVLTDPLKKNWQYLALNKYLDSEVYEYLALSDDQTVLQNLIWNSTAYKIVAETLVKRPHVYIRALIAKSLYINDQIESLLVRDASEYVLLALAENARSEKTLEYILQNCETSVKCQLAKTNVHLYKELQFKIIKNSNEEVVIALTKNSELNTEVADELAESTNIEILKSLASNRNLDPNTAEKLVRRGILEVNLSLIKNSHVLYGNSFAVVVNKLAQYDNEEIQKTLLDRNYNHGDYIQILLNSHYPDVVLGAQKKNLSKDISNKLEPAERAVSLASISEMTKDALLELVENPLTAPQQAILLALGDEVVLDKFLNSGNFVYDTIKMQIGQLYPRLTTKLIEKENLNMQSKSQRTNKPL